MLLKLTASINRWATMTSFAKYDLCSLPPCWGYTLVGHFCEINVKNSLAKITHKHTLSILL